MWIKKICTNFNIKKNFSKNKCVIKHGVQLNNETILEEKIVVHKNSNICNSKIGMGSYLGWNCNFSHCEIGRFTSIAPFSEVIYGNHPINNFVSTHPSFFSTRRQAGFTFVNKNKFDDYKFADSSNRVSVIIGNDVWIGYGAKILEGIIIGDGAVIGAGAIVTKDVEPYSIVVGSPAKKIKYRFEKKYIDFLMNFKWWNKGFEWIEENSYLFDNIDKFYNKHKEKIWEVL